MPAPKRANVAAAAAARRRIGDAKAATRLREAGWQVIPPEVVDQLPADVVRCIEQATSAEQL